MKTQSFSKPKKNYVGRNRPAVRRTKIHYTDKEGNKPMCGSFMVSPTTSLITTDVSCTHCISWLKAVGK